VHRATGERGHPSLVITGASDPSEQVHSTRGLEHVRNYFQVSDRTTESIYK
jgi:hypothetical protein